MVSTKKLPQAPTGVKYFIIIIIIMSVKPTLLTT